MKKTKSLEWLFELLWIIFAAIASIVLCYSLLDTVKREFLLPVLSFCFLSLTYFRIILFTKENPFIKNIVLRILFFVVNIPLFFAIIIKLQDFFYLFDHYNIEQFLDPNASILAEEGLRIYHTFRAILIASAVSSLLLILILEFKIARYVFKYFK